MKWEKLTSDFNRVFWFSGDYTIHKTNDKNYPYELGHKSKGYSYQDGEFKTLTSAKKYAEEQLQNEVNDLLSEKISKSLS